MTKVQRSAAAVFCAAAFATGAAAAPIVGSGDPAAHPGVIDAITRTFEGVPTSPDDSHMSITLDGVTFTGYDTRGLAGPPGMAAPFRINDRYAIYAVASVGPGPYPGYTTDGTYHYYSTDGRYNSTGLSLSNGEESINYSGGDPLPYVTQFRFDFATPTEYFGFNLGSLDNTWTLTTYDDDDRILDELVIGPQLASTGQYYGATAESGIAYAMLTASLGIGENWADGEMIILDNFVTGGFDASAVSEVPVPAGLPMLLGALGAFGLAGWRAKRAA